MKTSQELLVPVRGLTYAVRVWGGPPAPLLVLLHGWMDVSASFQFLVDAFAADWHCAAPDWRGFGRTGRPAADCYWFPDYVADLDAVLERLSPQAPVVLVGHSMGGNVALMYAGIRPQRVRAVVNLEGFGLRDAAPAQAPERYARWLAELRDPPRLRDYASLTEVAARLRANNPRLAEDHARWLAAHWAEPADTPGRWRLAADPAHRIVNPILYRWAEVAALWDRIACPVLWVEGAQTDAYRWADEAAALAQRRALLRDCVAHRIDDAGHMLHHDQPAALAVLIERFLHERLTRA